ncbi:MAG TPA: tetratricopeptide repeat protein [Acidimicrobiales bacterium]|nr:tetratricopeptide repeat protein [Acidimicrobiales bacterium]
MNDDERAELRERQAFLLRSIADLDAEAAVGDLSAADHAALRDDYVARAADCTRQLEGVAPVPVSAIVPRTRSRRSLVTIGACVALASVAGLALAASAGSRTDGAPVTGSLPASTSERLGLAGRLIGEGKAVDAVKIYDRILAGDPQHPVALAYRGWVVRLAGLKEEGLEYVERAVAADSSYPDAHFFRGMMLWEDKQDPAAAVAEFRLFLSNRPPQQMVPLVEKALREAASEAGLPVE